jgi:hypothetical protein
MILLLLHFHTSTTISFSSLIIWFDISVNKGGEISQLYCSVGSKRALSIDDFFGYGLVENY